MLVVFAVCSLVTPTQVSYAWRMARLFTSREFISYFAEEDGEGLSEVIFPGSEDELGMDEELDADSEPDFEPLEILEG